MLQTSYVAALLVDTAAAGDRAEADLEAGLSDGIMVTAGGPRVPQELVDQLAPGGRMLIPVGSLEGQDLMLVTRTRGGFPSNKLGPCRFVPLISSDAWPLPSSEAVT